MSGIEVAGLVLGAFPIAVWALEQYRDVARRLGFWYEIRLEYQRTSSDLKFHRLLFVQNLKQLLLPLVADDAQLQRLIVEPGGPAWNDPAIAQALESRLSDSYGLYLEILGEMERVMRELNDELAVDKKGIQTRVGEEKGPHAIRKLNITGLSKLQQPFNKANRDYQLFRIKFSNSESTRRRLFAELQTYNDRLEKLTATSDIVANLEAGRLADKASAFSSMNSAICKFWNHADRMYKALLEAWNCGCREPHCGQLILQHRTTVEKDFRLHLSPTIHGASETNTWSWCSVRVRMLDKPPINAAVTVAKGSPTTDPSVQISTPMHKSKIPLKSALASVQRNKTASANAKMQQSGQSSTVTIAKVAEVQKAVSLSAASTSCQSKPQQDPATGSPIRSLCQTLGNGVNPPSCVGFVENDDIRYYIYSEADTPPSATRPINLGQILSGEVKPALTRRQRYRLSLTLASSFVQLKDSPWLETPWDKTGVFFASKKSTAADVPPALRLDSPFIMRSFLSSPTPPAQATAVAATAAVTATTRIAHDVAGIASLGVVLLELCFGSPIGVHPSRARLPAGDARTTAPAFDLIAALEWLHEVHDEAGADYSKAVEWCLAGCRTLPAAAAGGVAGGGEWRRLMLERVVAPLERCCMYLG